uniref:Aladin seven-bladed propeller domain-containing protein n=1 Tax=Cuerna arida TaxID=1464854 RepID=A0A1B6FTZ0_9HEMI
MACSLADFPSLPEGTQIPMCLVEGKVQYSTPDFTNVHIYTTSVSTHPHILISNDVLHPAMSKEDSNRVFLPVSQTLWKKLQQSWYEKGFVSMLEIASNPRENQGFIVLEFVAKQTLSALKVASKFYSLIPGYKKKESGEVLAPMLSQNSVYCRSNIRCLAWHPHCIKLAVAASDDSIRIYSENSQLIPLLKCRGQHLISSMAWRPLCASELAVGCELGVVIWHIDPNSVITRPSAANTHVLSRPNHMYVTSLAWSPHGDLLVSGSASDNTMYVWAVGLDKAVPLKRVGGGGISFVSWSPDSLKLFAATTNLVFRVWETCQWEPDRWTLATGRVVSAVWSPCSSLVLFAVSLEPVIYCLSCGAASSVFQSEDRRAATPLIDLTPVELDSGERVGGEVSSLVWDKKGCYLAVTFKNCDIIAVFMTSFVQNLKVSPCCFIRGLVSESPAVIAFQENFTEGANLTIGWSSGRVQYFPIVFTELLSNEKSYEADMLAYDLPDVSTAYSPTASFVGFS